MFVLNRIMKYIILILALLAFWGCDENAPTKNDVKENLDKKYTLEELESDPNWVEITDIDTLEIPCIWYDLYERGKVIRTDAEYKDLYSESKALMEHSEFACKNDTNYIDVDFIKRDLILYEVSTNGGSPLFKRKIFKNSKLNQFRYVLEITITDVTKEEALFAEAISITKISNDTEMIFDTLRYYDWSWDE